MNNVRNEYRKRLSEVELYFDTLQLLDKGSCTIKCVDILGNEEVRDIDSDLSKILKANGFLLLYNLVEATIANSIQAIFNSMHSAQITYRDLTEKLRRMWIRQEFKNPGHNNILFNILSKVVDDSILIFSKDCVNISGNIDAQKIREISDQFGCQQISDGRHLCTIKEKRNKLAHGEYTFAEIGKDYSVSDMENFKDSVKEYLTKVMDEIEKFINNKGYSKTKSTY